MKAHVTIGDKTLPPVEDQEIRIQIVSDRLDGSYVLLVFTDEGIIADVVNDVSGEVEGTSSKMWDDFAERLTEIN